MISANRYYANRYDAFQYQLDRLDINGFQERINHFLETSISLLQQSLGGMHGPMNLYVGKVGIEMAINRGQRFLSHEKVKFPDLNVVGGEVRHRGTSIGLTSDDICLQLYNSMRSKTPFSIDPSAYQAIGIEDELLNGRCGLALLVDYFKSKGMPLANPHLTQDILSSVNVSAFPWSWNGKVYYGAAHGTSGILLVLERLGNHHLVDLFGQLIQDARISSSGNFKSSQGSKRDELVQWCHGVTGFIPLMLQFHNLLPTSIEKASNLTHIMEGLRVVWERGFLTKGCGVCHGIAGNGYSFLSAYVVTLNVQHLMETIVFAMEILRIGPEMCCVNADRPYSLFEGLAGTIHFLMDVSDILRLHERNEADAIQHYKLFDGLMIF